MLFRRNSAVDQVTKKTASNVAEFLKTDGGVLVDFVRYEVEGIENV